MINGKLILQVSLASALFLHCSSGIAETFGQENTLSGVWKTVAEEERRSRNSAKPISEMSDIEVIEQAEQKVQDKVNNALIGFLSATETVVKGAVKNAADYIREQEPTNTTTPQEPSPTIITPTPTCDNRMSRAKPDAATTGDSPMVVPISDNPRIKPETESGSPTAAITVLVILLIGAVCLYGVTYARVMAGHMVVYVSWGDFVASCAWVLLVPLGYCLEYESSHIVLATILKVMGVLSAIWMIGGAFQNKRAINILIAVPARLIVALLSLLACAKLSEAMDGIKNRRKGVITGVLLPLGIALFIFNSLLKPMIGDKRHESLL